jgi:hypothetical protein
MITSNSIKLEDGERKRIRILTTNGLKERQKDEVEGPLRPPTKVNGRMLQAGAVPPDDPGPREIRVFTRPGKTTIATEKTETKAKKKPGPKPGTKKAKA